MSNSFHRVSQSLRRDGGWHSAVSLSMGALLFAAWLIWAFKAEISRYEVSLSAHVEVDGSTSQHPARIMAEFPISALGELRPGQSARFHMEGLLAAQHKSVSACLSRVVPAVRDNRVAVEFWIDSKSSSRMSLVNGLPGSVEVETERVSPAALILRSAGALASSN